MLVPLLGAGLNFGARGSLAKGGDVVRGHGRFGTLGNLHIRDHGVVDVFDHRISGHANKAGSKSYAQSGSGRAGIIGGNTGTQRGPCRCTFVATAEPAL